MSGYGSPSLGPLFDRRSEPSPLDHRTEQQRQLARVEGTIAGTVLSFCRQRLAEDRPTFVVEELHAYVRARHVGAPGSPDRVLRDLRRKWELIDYDVLDRRASLYRLLSVAEVDPFRAKKPPGV